MDSNEELLAKNLLVDIKALKADMLAIEAFYQAALLEDDLEKRKKKLEQYSRNKLILSNRLESLNARFKELEKGAKDVPQDGVRRNS